MTMFEKIESTKGNEIRFQLPVPVLDVDLVDHSMGWKAHYFNCATVLTTDLDVSLTITGFWGKNSEMQLTATCTGAPEVATAVFKSADTSTDAAAAIYGLNQAIENLLLDYLPRHDWNVI